MATENSSGRIWSREFLGLVALVLGFILLAASLLSPWMSSQSVRWSDEKALQYQTAAARIHELSLRAGNTPLDEQSRELQTSLTAAQSEYASLHRELDEARNMPSRVAEILRYLGIASFILGLTLLVLPSRFSTNGK